MEGISQPASPQAYAADEGKTLTDEDLQDVQLAANRLDLAHEIALDNNFKLRQSPEVDDQQAQAFKTVRGLMERAFWDALRDSLQQTPPNYDHAFTLLAEIKEILLPLAGMKINHRHKQIEEVLDVDHLRHQAENDALDIARLAASIIDMMAEVCAPARDELVAKLRDIDDLTDLFKEIYAVLQVMSKDVANVYIQSFRPIIQQHQIEYERKNFAVLVDKLPNALHATKLWLKNAFDRTVQDHLQTAESERTSSAESKVSPFRVLSNAYISLLTGGVSQVDAVFPETLSADRQRFDQMHQCFESITLTVALLVSSFSCLDFDVAANLPFVDDLKSQLLVLIDVPPSNDDDLTALLNSLRQHIHAKTCEHLQRSSPQKAAHAQSRRDALKSNIDKFVPLAAHPVYQLLRRRCAEYVVNVACASVRATAVPADLAVPSGLHLVSAELKKLARTYSKIVNLNQAVYGPFYVPILKDSLEPFEANNNNANAQ